MRRCHFHPTFPTVLLSGSGQPLTLCITDAAYWQIASTEQYAVKEITCNNIWIYTQEARFGNFVYQQRDLNPRSLRRHPPPPSHHSTAQWKPEIKLYLNLNVTLGKLLELGTIFAPALSWQKSTFSLQQ